MAYSFKQNLVASNKYSVKCPYTMTPIGFCVHNTANNASAANEIKYMISNNNQVSYHYAVDEKEVIQGLPTNRNAWASGDGANGNGNRKYIHIEICRSTGDLATFKQCEQNCAEFLAKELKSRGWGVDKVKKHQDFSNKYCPHKTLDLGWDRFIKLVQAELDKLNKPTTSTTSFKVRIKCAELNIRQSASFDSKVVGKVRKGEVFTIVEVKNNLGRLKSGAGWISMNSPYVERV